MGDFNVSLHSDESTAGTSSCTLAMQDFQECVDSICMSDINRSGFQFTWNQWPRSSSSILKKIDQVMGNDVFIDKFTNAYAVFYPYRISDHFPTMIKIPVINARKPKPFKFGNYVIKNKEFHDTVSREWAQDVAGHEMFKLVKRLRMIKRHIRTLMWSKGDMH
ncbi:uncharacterized protein [Rutidosis leptorrhynchoides]|uniref:uncharacterized protein n=1 Tax=Rutidosis leptorrhynchoides TaxID=125765 RepID=UPI003A991C51